MKKSLYYRTVLTRKYRLRDAILMWTLNFAGLVRPLIEVFTRTNFGERYLRFSVCLSSALFFCFLPFMAAAFKAFLAAFFRMGSDMGMGDNLQLVGSSMWKNIKDHYLTWYLFFAVFLYFSWKQRKYTRRSRSLFDFSKFSISSGDIHPVFFREDLPVIGKADLRTIECYLEPLPFFVGGLLLMLLGQAIGNLLVFASVMYCLGYIAAYRRGDNFILDKIDEIISNEELADSFMNDDQQVNKRGFKFTGTKPEDPEARRKLLPLLLQEDDAVDAG